MQREGVEGFGGREMGRWEMSSSGQIRAELVGPFTVMIAVSSSLLYICTLELL